MAEFGVPVDHATIHRWSIKMMPALAAVFRQRKRPVGSSWRMGKTHIKISGEWKYMYRAVGRVGHTIDFLVRAKRDLAAARCFFERAIDLYGVPEKITIDKSGANTAAIVRMRADSGADIETMHMIKKGGSSSSSKTEPRLLLTSSTPWPSEADRFDVTFTLSLLSRQSRLARAAPGATEPAPLQVPRGVRLVGFDDERSKGDHCHVGGRERAYTFVSVEQLVKDLLRRSTPHGEANEPTDANDHAAAALESRAARSRSARQRAPVPGRGVEFREPRGVS